MDSDLPVLEYLEKYRKSTDKLFLDYFAEKKIAAKKIGILPADLLLRLKKTTILGKRIRGALMVLGYEVAGGKDLQAIYDASLFIELIHAGLLLHDDIMDGSETRRGILSLHKQYNPSGFGRSMAILGGDILFYLGWEKLVNSRFPVELKLPALKKSSDYLSRVIYGQVLDIEKINRYQATEELILNTFKFKTAEYTGVLPIVIGACLAGVKDEKKTNLLKEYGLALGWAFQIQDDILGIYGDKQKTGKPIGTDLREGKKSLFIYHILKKGSENQKKFILSIMGNRNIKDDDIEKAREIFRESGAYKYVLNLGWKNVNQGRKLIQLISHDKKKQKILESFLTFMMERTR